MPALSKKQRRFFGAELGRKRRGKKTRTGLTAKQLKEFSTTSEKGLPEKALSRARKRFKRKK